MLKECRDAQIDSVGVGRVDMLDEVVVQRDVRPSQAKAGSCYQGRDKAAVSGCFCVGLVCQTGPDVVYFGLYKNSQEGEWIKIAKEVCTQQVVFDRVGRRACFGIVIFDPCACHEGSIDLIPCLRADPKPGIIFTHREAEVGAQAQLAPVEGMGRLGDGIVGNCLCTDEKR